MGSNYAEVPASRKYSGILMILLVTGAVAVSVRMLFGGFVVDDAYHIAMSYRHAFGDRIFMEMWEPHQTSAFLCAVLIRAFVGVTGSTTYLVLYLRLCALIIHGIVNYVLFKTVRSFLRTEHAALIALISYCSFVKLTAVPEFSNMMVWFLTLSLCALYKAYEKEFRNGGMVALGATFYSLAVISYPTLLLLAIGFLALFLSSPFAGKIKGLTVFFATCAVEGAAYLVAIFIGKDMSKVWKNIGYMLRGDNSHLSGYNMGGESLVSLLGKDFALIVVAGTALYGVSIVVCRLWNRRKNSDDGLNLDLCTIVACYVLTIVSVVFLRTGYDCLKAQYLVIPVCAVVLLGARKSADATSKFLLMSVLIGSMVIVSVELVSNVRLLHNIAFLQSALIWGIVGVAYSLGDLRPKNVGKVLYMVLFATMFVTCFTQRKTVLGDNVLQYNGLVSEGTAKGIIADYVIKSHYESGVREIREILKEDDGVLIFSDDIYASAWELYLAAPVKICQHSTIYPVNYGEIYREYWEEFPDRIPSLVVVENVCYESVKDSYAYDFLFNTYDYACVKSGEHFTYYRRMN